MKETEKSTLDPQLWHACAGSMVQMPPVNSTVFYFPQGHAEHASSPVDFSSSPKIAPLILCTVSSVKFLADPETDEVYAKIRLVPLPSSGLDFNSGDEVFSNSGEKEKPASFAKTLTQSDANNGGGFSVPRYCAETIFPRLDYSADPPVQTVIARDVHGEMWKFRHIYRGTPRRHLLTTGWSSFVNQKKLVAGDSIVFLRDENGELCVGIRRTKRGLGAPPDSPASWTYSGFSVMLRKGGDSKLARNNGAGKSTGPEGFGRGKVSPESVIEAVSLAARGQPFEVVFYPRASTPEFCMKASSVRAATRVQWCSGMRFKMAFETEDSSRISWFLGTISSVQVIDPTRWPNSPWRLLQVTWDEPDLLQNVTRVSPWLVELVSSIPIIHMSPFSPPSKKYRLPQHHASFPSLDGHLLVPPFSGNLLGGHTSTSCLLPDNFAPASIQGARHNHFPSIFTDLNLSTKLPLGPFGLFPPIDPHKVTVPVSTEKGRDSESLSCSLKIGYPSQNNSEKPASEKKRKFLLFGQTILTEQQIISQSTLSDTTSDRAKALLGPKRSSNANLGFSLARDIRDLGLGLNTGHCKVFLESEDVGRTLDLSAVVSYEELYHRLVAMFGIERSDLQGHVLYEDAMGVVRKAGNEPFSDFIRTAKRLTILMDSGSKSIGRALISRSGFESSTKSGPLSTYA
ncbi:auxin response factor 10-like isoform X1 [Punica granatum]|uniref:Auxin response factor n=2 Tax=Punica granatum TaxID=22663 RepID=A0A218WA02_PUNGR|nr:auxin response factor 10-like isoform X1 [Punica granatum]XP_031401431.1 auxin response factor 10-like isoform X1 [Punica granatum]OWM68902.1 hypothetical protein CDL15_Pgr025089 [Punica granatum]